MAGELVYVVLIGGLAAVAMSGDQRRPLVLVAALVALPCGVTALVGLYVLTGVFNLFASGFSDSSSAVTSGGCDVSGHCWQSTTGTPVGAQGLLFDTCVVGLFVAAALVNVLVLRSLVRSRKERQTALAVAGPHAYPSNDYPGNDYPSNDYPGNDNDPTIDPADDVPAARAHPFAASGSGELEGDDHA